MSKSLVFIRIEEGKKDVVTSWPEDKTSTNDAFAWCSSEGYDVINYEIVPMTGDPDFATTVKLFVKPKPKER